LYFVGSLISNLGTWLQSTAQVLIAYQVTHSVFTVGVIASAQFAGMIAVSPWAAVLADKFSPRAVLVGAQLISAIIAGWMAYRYISGALGVHSLVFGALGLGSAYALALPVQTALVPGLVRDGDATEAVKMNSVSYNAGRALAPALCVLLIATAGPYLIFTLNAVSFVIFAIVLRQLRDVVDDKSFRAVIGTGLRYVRRLTISVALGVTYMIASVRLRRRFGRALLVLVLILGLSRPDPAASENRAKAAPKRPRASVTDGLIIALHNRRIVLLLSIVAAVTLADDPVFVLSPALAHTTLDTTTRWAGYFIAALGWGSVLGSLPPTSARSNTQNASRRAAYALLVLGVSIVVFAMGFSTSISLVAAFVAGGAGLFTGAAAQTALLNHQRKSGASLTSVASVAALWAIAWAGSKPFASLADGWLGSHIGIVQTALILASPAIVIAVCEILLPEGLKKQIKVRAGWFARRVIRGARSTPIQPGENPPAADVPWPDFTPGQLAPREPCPPSPGAADGHCDPCDSRDLYGPSAQDALGDAVPQGA
jgi:MFS family permease